MNRPAFYRRGRSRVVPWTAAGVVALAASTPALAQSQWNAGQVTVYHLNSVLPGRGACVQMSPAFPETVWACLWQANPLYKELNALLLTAYHSGKNCSILLQNPKDSTAAWQIQVAECR